MNKVVLFIRKSYYTGNFSIERVFKLIYDNVNSNVDIDIFVSRFHSQGFFKRIYNIFEGSVNQGRVNHISGDIHYLALLMNGSKTILTIHDFVILRRSSGVMFLIYYLFWYYLPIIKVRQITVISNQIKNELIDLFPFAEHKVQVIHNPITIPSEYFNSHTRTFNSNFPKILHIGTSENKNLYNTILALKSINCHLRIVGKIDDFILDILNDFNIYYSNVSNLTVNEIIEEYLDADLLSFVSTYEGFGLPIIEAQYIGLPVITSNIPVIKEISGLPDDCLVDPLDYSAIALFYSRIINDESYRKRITKLGLSNISRFSTQFVSNQFIDLYNKF